MIVARAALDLDAIARRFGVRHSSSIDQVSPRVARARDEEHDVAIKVYEGADPGARVECALLGALAAVPDARFRVQRLVAMEDGSALLNVDGHAVLATHWEEGEKRRYEDIDDATWASLGAALAAIHRALGDGNPLGLTDLVETVRGRDLVAERALIERHRDAVAARAGARFASYFAQRLALLDEHGPHSLDVPEGARAGGALHNDYNEHNYLFTAGEPPLILDFERAVWGPRELEVVRCLNHLPLVAPARASLFVDAYRRVRPLRQELLAWAVDVALTAHAVKHWPVERLLRNEPGAEELLAGMADMVSAFATGAPALHEFFATIANITNVANVPEGRS